MDNTTTLNSSDNAAAMDDRRLLELLLIMMVIHSLLPKEGDDDDDTHLEQMKEMVMQSCSVAIKRRGDQSAVSNELLALTQRLLVLDEQQLRSLDGGETEGGVEVSSSASEHQLMDSATAAKEKKAVEAAKKKKKRNKRNKAAAKHKGTKRMSWLGGGIISLLMMATFGSMTLSHIPRSDGSSEGNKAPPTLPPSASTSLRQKDLQSSNMAQMSLSSVSPSVSNPPMNSVDEMGSSEGKAPPTVPPSTTASLRQRNRQSSYNMASTSPSSRSPLAAVVQAPVFSPVAVRVSNPPMNSVDERALLTCLNTPNWKNKGDRGCDWYEKYYVSGCPGTDIWAGNMGPATEHCCYCGGGSHTLPPTTSPKPSSSPTKSSTPSSSPTESNSPTKSATPSSFPSSTPSMCTDTGGWFDWNGYDCSWYKVMDVPGCPQYGSNTAYWSSTAEGSAKDNCCYCKNDVISTLVISPTKAPSSSGKCVDTPGWEDYDCEGCEYYRTIDDPGCPKYGNDCVGDMGPAADNCCYCKDPSCEDFWSKCQEYTNSNYWTDKPGRVKGVCDEAASSCSCGATEHVKIVTNLRDRFNETVGLYNECKCDFWFHLCEDTRQGEACDYAAEYCCGDYRYYALKSEAFKYLNSPLCYCDFFNYAQNEFGHTLKPKALNVNKEFSNPCGQFEEDWSLRTLYERVSLEAIYNATNGQNWTKSDGWMNETVDHCQWYGISCDDHGLVTSIDLKGNNLEGQFPVYSRNLLLYSWTTPLLDSKWQWSKYGLANLYKLKTLDLSNNKLTGTIEYAPLYNLHSLTYFDVSGNQLSGEVEALVAPSLIYAYFSNNFFTTMRRFQRYKVSPLETLRYCDVSNNAIQEDVTDLLENIPPNIVQFIASNNNISGFLPASLNNLQKLRQFNMASNALSGKLPGFTESFVTLEELDVSNQTIGFTGSIPDNVWRSLSLKILNLADNWLTGTIPSLIGNLAVLEVFDLSNNRLESSIPAELGKLEGFLKRIDLSNNIFSGSIPSEIGKLQGAFVFLKGNPFHNISIAPLSLCLKREVEEFDLAIDTTLCPPERNALSDFHESAKGAEWTDQGNKIDGSLWLDEYASYCDWKGVTCDNNTKHVTELNLTNNGLSGRLSESIGNLTFIEVLDLSDNDIKGSIPTELGKLSLKKLRLSYNAFTGAAPEGLGEMKGLQLLQLQSNRITEMPNIPRLDNIHGQSTFVTDCGVPYAFEMPLYCDNCTMCCNANDECYPQEKTQVQQMGMRGYKEFAAFVLGCFVVLCCIVALLLYLVDKHKSGGITLTTAMETRIKEDDEYALSKIGKDSVYSYFVTHKVFGWLAALATLGIQTGILVVFVMASEVVLQEDTIDIQFTWKCPRDNYSCSKKADLNEYGWAIFCVLMVAFLAKDMISGSKLIHHSAKVRHSLGSRIRYFFGGMCLCSITLFALYVSTVYNKAIATSNTEIIVNSVIVLFVMELDEWIFSDLEAINEKWTAHAEDGTIDEMKAQIASQQEEIRVLREELQKVQESQGKRERIASQQEEELRKLRELVQKILESQTAAAATTNSENVSEFVGDTNARQMEQVDDNNAQ